MSGDVELDGRRALITAIIEGLIASHGLTVVGAEYSFETGVMEFLEETIV